MRCNDVDRICNRDYVVGAGWFLLSLCFTALVVLFEWLPISIQIAHAPGFGAGQVVLTIIGIVNICGSLWYFADTVEKQRYLGE